VRFSFSDIEALKSESSTPDTVAGLQDVAAKSGDAFIAALDCCPGIFQT
jgi:hypothetical protein